MWNEEIGRKTDQERTERGRQKSWKRMSSVNKYRKNMYRDDLEEYGTKKKNGSAYLMFVDGERKVRGTTK